MIYLAIRQLLSRKKQSALIFLGISFGTMIYVIIAGLQFGFREYIIEQLLNNTAHVLISGSERTIDQKELRGRFFNEDDFVKWIVPPAGKRDEAKLEYPQGWFDRLRSDVNVVAYAPRLTINAIVSRGNNRKNVSFQGIVPRQQVNITSQEDYMKEGSLLDLSAGANTIVLTSGVMESIGARVGETVRVSTGVGEARPFKVVGKLKMGNEQVDNSLVLGNIRDVQNLNRTPGRVSSIAVSLTDLELSQSVADTWSLFSRDKVQSWQEANAQFMQMIKIQDIMRYIITSAILLVAGFGIYNILTIMIAQKQKEIAILRSIGYAPDKILELFLVQGFVLGFFGGVLGLIFGFVLNQIVGSIDLGFEIGKSNHLLISYQPSIFVTAMFAAQVAAAIASYLPARAASRLTPLEIIRAE